MDRVLAVDIGQQPEPAPKVRVCNRKGVVLDFHVWDEPRLTCLRCGFTRAVA